MAYQSCPLRAHHQRLAQSWGRANKCKTVAVIFMATALTIGIYFKLPVFVLVIQAVVFSTVCIFLLTRPAPPK